MLKHTPHICTHIVCLLITNLLWVKFNSFSKGPGNTTVIANPDKDTTMTGSTNIHTILDHKGGPPQVATCHKMTTMFHERTKSYRSNVTGRISDDVNMHWPCSHRNILKHNHNYSEHPVPYVYSKRREPQLPQSFLGN